jgi:phosphate starvation-inducible PhoH-like protein
MHSKDYPATRKRKRLKVELITDYRHQKEFFKEPENTKYKVLHPKNENQKKYLKSLEENTITIAVGCPGTAKTLLALYYGFKLIESRQITKIYYIKPNVGSRWERDIGATPGEMKDKLNDLVLDPVKDNLPVFMSIGEMNYHLDKGTIEAKLFANIRGATFRDCIVILDECQNVPPEAVKTFLTRMGTNCKMVVCGDERQQDVNLHHNGLTDVVSRLKNLSGVGIVRFTREDIVRNGLIKQILERYEGLS